MAWMPSETDVMTGETDVERRLVIGKLSNLIGLVPQLVGSLKQYASRSRYVF